jgi:transposase
LLVYLPPYSPDFNPIETSFAVLKQWIRKHALLIESFDEEDGGFEAFLRTAIDAQHCGEALGDPGNLFRQSYIHYES